MNEPTYHDGIKDVISYWTQRALTAERECEMLRLQLATMRLQRDERDRKEGR
jgi:hypothetical protein